MPQQKESKRFELDYNVDIFAYKDTEDMISKIEEYIELLGGKI